MTPCAKRPWNALTGRCKVAVFLAAVMVSGCAGRETAVPAAPVIVRPAVCVAPTVPALPQLDPALPLDAPQNVETLLRRDDICRRYIQGLRATVRCYEAQIQE